MIREDLNRRIVKFIRRHVGLSDMPFFVLVQQWYREEKGMAKKVCNLLIISTYPQKLLK